MGNPILSRPDAFTPGTQSYGAPQGYGPGYGQQGYGQPQYGQPAPQGYQQPQQAGGVMTLDDVIAKTGIMLLVLLASAVAAFMLVPTKLLMPVWIVSGLVTFVTVLFVSFWKTLPVGGVMLYAVIEGIFLGTVSKFFEILYPGIVLSAVVATFVTAGLVLAAYKFFNIRVTPKFQKMVFIGTAAFAATMLVNLGLVMFGIDTGIRNIGSGAGWIAIGVSLLAVGLAVFNLIIDFDYIEKGIAMGAPAKESWRAAFGITVTMAWLYIEMLRILSYFRNN